MLKVALVAPAGTGTVGGTCAAALLLDRLTDRPPLGAAMLSVTVPVELCPPVTVDGFTVMDCSPGVDVAGGMTLPHHVPHWLPLVLLGTPAYSCTVQKSVSLTGSTCVAL